MCHREKHRRVKMWRPRLRGDETAVARIFFSLTRGVVQPIQRGVCFRRPPFDRLGRHSSAAQLCEPPTHLHGLVGLPVQSIFLGPKLLKPVWGGGERGGGVRWGCRWDALTSTFQKVYYCHTRNY
jgi:hypothetical protein